MRSFGLCIKAHFEAAIMRATRCATQIERPIREVCPLGTRSVPATCLDNAKAQDRVRVAQRFRRCSRSTSRLTTAKSRLRKFPKNNVGAELQLRWRLESMAAHPQRRDAFAANTGRG